MKFIEKYSFEQKCLFDVSYALRHNGHVVAMMSFAKCNNEKYEWEIVGYEEVNSIIVNHGFSSLLYNFVDKFNCSRICCRISRDWNFIRSIDSSVKIINVTDPCMYWTKKQSRWDS